MSKPYYGGQAVIEGVMMRGQRNVTVAVRHPSGKIVTQSEVLQGALYRRNWAKAPFLRGIVMLWEMLVLGTRMLMFSAEVAMDTGEKADAPAMPKGVLWGTIIFSLAAGVGLFFVTPVLLAGLLDRWAVSSFVSNLVEKVFRLGLLVGYMFFVGRIPDIKRVFAYHGAEHKTINAYEAGAPLDVEHVRRYSTAHPRCGTSFLLIVVVVSFVVYLLLGKPPMAERILSRVVLIPIIAGIAYEFIRLGANHYGRRWVRVLLAPGLALQRLTTREPDDAQLETAIVALERVIAADQAISPAPAALGEVPAATIDGMALELLGSEVPRQD